MPNTKQSYKEKCLEQFEEQFKDSFTYGAMETWEDGLAVKDFISKALEEQMKEVIKCLPSKAPIPDHICESGCVYSIGEGYNQVLEEFKENLKQAGLI